MVHHRYSLHGSNKAVLVAKVPLNVSHYSCHLAPNKLLRATRQDMVTCLFYHTSHPLILALVIELQ